MSTLGQRECALVATQEALDHYRALAAPSMQVAVDAVVADAVAIFAAPWDCNLAEVLQDLGELPPARSLFERALASDLNFGKDHPTVAMRRNNLALVLQNLGELPTARCLLEQALTSDLKTFGEDHPTVATIRNNLASVLQALGELPAARSR